MRGTRAALDALAAGSGLLAGQVYVITDEGRLAVALTTSTFETFAREDEAGATVSEVPGALATPYLQTARLIQGADDVRLPVGYLPGVDLRQFGAVMTGLQSAYVAQAVAEANTTALVAALAWSTTTGGIVRLPAGRLDIWGPVELPLGAGIRGEGQHSSRIQQTQLPTGSGEAWQSVFTAPTVSGSTGGNGYNVITDLTIDGGWNMRDWIGAAHVNWAHDPARMVAVGLALNTPTGGPPAGAAVRGASSDAQSRIQNVTVQNVAGRGLQIQGRGENFLSVVEVQRAGTHGVWLESPDCFLHQITSYLSGDSGIVIKSASGNLRMTNCKSWFTGMQSAAECVGAGIQIPDAGTLALEMSEISTQDTWGPGLEIQGDTGIKFSGDLDNAGGGRVTQQGFGFTGTRTLPRSFIRIPGTLRRALINARIRGGAVASGALPHLVDLRGSGVIGCKVDLNGDLASINATRVNTTAGHTNANRYNEVWFAGQLLHGRMTQAQLDNAAHGVNDTTYPITQVIMDTGRIAVKAGGAWVVSTDGVDGDDGAPGADGADAPPMVVLTQAAYDALGTPDAETFYFISG